MSHIYQGSKLLAPVVYFTDPVQIRLWAVWEEQDVQYHGLRTPNEGINQRYLKNLADVAD